MALTSSALKDAGPWYKQPWPWILMSGPAMVVVASLISAWVALSSADGLVVEDYYKKGLSADQTIAMNSEAKRLGVETAISLTASEITVSLKSDNKGFVFPPKLTVTLAHPTRAGLDQVLSLLPSGTEYRGAYRLPKAGHWIVTVQDDAGSWRVMGNVSLPASGVTVIGGSASTDIHNQH